MKRTWPPPANAGRADATTQNEDQDQAATCAAREGAADGADETGLPLLGDGELYCLTHRTNRMHGQDGRACRWQQCPGPVKRE